MHNTQTNSEEYGTISRLINNIDSTMGVLKIKDQCKNCSGNGEIINDSCNHVGEHQQDVEVCRKCNGSGLKNGI